MENDYEVEVVARMISSDDCSENENAVSGGAERRD